MDKTLKEHLHDVLIGTLDMKIRAHQSHFNVSGPNFYALHALFQEVYEELEGAFDDIGERVPKAFGGGMIDLSPATWGAWREASLEPISDSWLLLIEEAGLTVEPGDANSHVGELWAANRHMQGVIQDAADAFDKAGDRALTSLLDGRLEAHDVHAYKLKSSLRC